MSQPLTEATKLRVADLPARQTRAFDITPDEAMRAMLAETLGIVALRKLRFHGTLAPLGRDGWHLKAKLGATAVQSCTATLAPVTTRIDAPVERRFLTDMPALSDLGETPEEGVPMPEDDTAEPLEATIDLARVLHEALALALPDYPRADDVAAADMQAAPPGTAPLTDDAMKPFAGLAGLKDKLERDD